MSHDFFLSFERLHRSLCEALPLLLLLLLSTVDDDEGVADGHHYLFAAL